MNLTTIPNAPATPEKVDWLGRYETMSATPSGAGELVKLSADMDLRPYLSRIQAPVLLIHDVSHPLVPLDGVRWLADRLPNATLKTTDMWSTHGMGRPMDRAFEEVEDFLLGTRLAGLLAARFRP